MVVEGGQVTTRILAGMEWIATKGVKTLNMSIGVRGFNSAFEMIIEALRNAGVLPVIAVGNDFANNSRSPGNYPTVLSVGACNQSDFVAGISSNQTFDRQNDPVVPDLVAPGVQILSCIPDGRYLKMDGTSQAAPHITGLAALLVQAKPDAPIDDVENAILQSCTLPATMREARANRGIPDAVTAFTTLTGHAPVGLVA